MTDDPARERDDRARERENTMHIAHRARSSESSSRRSSPFRLRSLCLLGFFAVVGVVDARYRGRAVGGRRIAGRGLGPRAADRVGIGRKLLSPPSVLPENGHCVVAYENVRRDAELSELTKIIDTLPRIKERLQDPTRVFTLFAPTNEAIEKLRAGRKPVDDFKNLRREVTSLKQSNSKLTKELDDIKKRFEAVIGKKKAEKK